MAIPNFNIDGLLPPFIGITPADHSSEMSPYKGTALDLVHFFGFTEGRKSILRGWLLHRKALCVADVFTNLGRKPVYFNLSWADAKKTEVYLEAPMLPF